ncbi:PAAR-like domain-containing protein [Mitsuaria sp. 7]|uniref:PAAR-like domain-containing protein n=1 Tax=Mitsuaria sp. 7 TaxID=1658665 RepID=UPI0008312C55|nr:PAAR-like domain-containing protein [Mitsuaria sp. 7]
MGSNVFANGREVSGKADGNMSNAAMPDVCLTPPPPPAGPIPIPYPNFSSDADTDEGTRGVYIGGKQVGQKNKSTFKKSTGDEAATKAQGMGVVTHTIQGATKHAAWSFDVKAENQNLTRHLDLTTHNHASDPQNSGSMTVKAGTISVMAPTTDECKDLQSKNDAKRSSLGHSSEASTITHGNYQPPTGNARTVWSCSRKLSGINDPSYCPGLPYDRDTTITNQKGQPRKAKQAAETNLCDEAVIDRQFEYVNDINIRNPHTSHTEPRIVESLLQAGSVNGGTLTLSINWNSQAGVQDVPCGHCHRVLCAAAACGLNIVLCTKVEQPPCDNDLSGSY